MSRARYHQFEAEAAQGPNAKYCKCGLHESDAEHHEARISPDQGPAPLVMPSDDAVKALLARIEDMMAKTGEFGQCRGCLEGVYWYTANPKGAKRRIAYNRDGTSHFTTCARQNEFSQPAAAQGVLS